MLLFIIGLLLGVLVGFFLTAPQARELRKLQSDLLTHRVWIGGKWRGLETAVADIQSTADAVLAVVNEKRTSR